MRTIGTKQLLAISTLAGALVMTTGITLAQESGVVRISAGSSDGDRISYVVRCANKAKGSVYSEGDRPAYCAIALGGKLRCNAKWTLNEASEYACKIGSNR